MERGYVKPQLTLIEDELGNTYREHEDDAAPNQTARRWASLSDQANRMTELLQSGNASLDTIRNSAVLALSLSAFPFSDCFENIFRSSRDHDARKNLYPATTF